MGRLKIQFLSDTTVEEYERSLNFGEGVFRCREVYRGRSIERTALRLERASQAGFDTLLARHWWNHFLYTGDLEFLRTVAFPVYEGAVAFFRLFGPRLRHRLAPVWAVNVT